MFFYVSFDGEEVVVNEIGSLLICIRLGVQPSTCPSSRSRAEIQQNRARLFLRCGQGLINVLAPINGHYRLPRVATIIEMYSGTPTTIQSSRITQQESPGVPSVGCDHCTLLAMARMKSTRSPADKMKQSAMMAVFFITKSFTRLPTFRIDVR